MGVVATPATAATTRTFARAQGRWETAEPLFHVWWLIREGCTGPATPTSSPGVITTTSWNETYSYLNVGTFDEVSVTAPAKGCVRT